jgi:hypothetical protein
MNTCLHESLKLKREMRVVANSITTHSHLQGYISVNNKED